MAEGGRIGVVLGLLFGAAACSCGSGGSSWLSHLQNASPYANAQTSTASGPEAHAELASDDDRQPDAANLPGVAPLPGEDDGGSLLDLLKPKTALPHDECVRRGQAHRSIEINTLRLKGVISSSSGNSVAMVAAGKRRDQALRVGDYIGTECWRVQQIGQEQIVLSEAYLDTDGQQKTRQVRLGVGDIAPADAVWQH